MSDKEQERRDVALQVVMEQSVDKMPWTRLSRIFDIREPGSNDTLAVKLMINFNFDDMTIKVAKYGNAHENFMQHLIALRIPMFVVLDACKKSKFPGQVLDELEEALRNGKQKFDERSKDELPIFYASLVESRENILSRSWRDIAELILSDTLIQREICGDERPSTTMFLKALLCKERIKVKTFIEKVLELKHNAAQEEFLEVIELMVDVESEEMARGRKIPLLQNRVADGQPLDHLFNVKDDMCICCHQSENHKVQEYLLAYKVTNHAPSRSFQYKCYSDSIDKQITLQKLIEMFKEKFEKAFAKELTHPDFCLINTNYYDDSKFSANFVYLCVCLQEWCSAQKCYTFLLTKYSPLDNLRKFNFNMESLQSSLELGDPILEDVSNKIVIYISKRKFLFNIRFVEVTQASKGHEAIRVAMQMGQLDIKLLTALFFNTLCDYGIKLINVVIILDASSSENEWVSSYDCSECQGFLIPMNEDLSDSKKLIKKLNDLLKVLSTRLKAFQASPENKNEAFLSLASKFWGYLSVEDVHLPCMSPTSNSIDTYDALSRVYLNKEQWWFVHMDMKKHPFVILKGCYGSGKSIVAQIKLKQFMWNAGPHDYIYYIHYANDSLQNTTLQSVISQLFPGRPHEQVFILSRHEYATRFHLPDPSVSSIIDNINKRHHDMNSVKLIVDEFDGSSLSNRESSNIKRYLEDSQKIQYILLVCATMETSRTRRTKKKSGKFLLVSKYKDLPYDGYCFDLLDKKNKKGNPFEIVVLDKVMRNSTNILTLAQTSVDFLQRNKITFYVPDTLRSSETRDVVTNDAESRALHGSNSSLNSVDSVDSSATEILEDTVEKYGFVTDPLTLREEQAKVTKSTYYTTSADSTTYDSVYKSASSLNSSSKKGEYIANSYRYSGDWKPGHEFSGKKPKLVYPFKCDTPVTYDEVNDPLVRNRLKIALGTEEILNIRGKIEMKRLCIICFDVIGALMYEDILNELNIKNILYLPNLGRWVKPPFLKQDQSSVIKCMQEGSILITDHVGVRGMEMRNVIICADPQECYLAPYIVEAITRCVDDLSFTILPTEVKPLNKDAVTLQNLIEEWKKRSLVDVLSIDYSKDECKTYGCIGYSEISKNESEKEFLICSHGNDQLYPGNVKRRSMVNRVEDIDDAYFSPGYVDIWEQKKEEERAKVRRLVQTFEENGISFIQELIKLNDTESCSLLLELNGVRDEITKLRTTDDEDTALHLAVRFSKSVTENSDMVDQLIEAGIYVDVQNKYGYTPLMMAILYDAPYTVVVSLYNSSSSLIMIDKLGYGSFTYPDVVIYNDEVCKGFELLRRKCNTADQLLERDPKTHGYLVSLMEGYDIYTVRYLVHRHKDKLVGVRSPVSNSTLLHNAVLGNQVMFVEVFLLHTSIDVNARDNEKGDRHDEGFTAACYAEKRKLPKIQELLRKHNIAVPSCCMSAS